MCVSEKDLPYIQLRDLSPPGSLHYSTLSRATARGNFLAAARQDRSESLAAKNVFKNSVCASGGKQALSF